MKLVGLCGSLRAASLNRKLLHEAARYFEADEFSELDLRFPLYDGDLETKDGVPELAKTAAAEISAADAVIVATPEYNKALSGVLKNAFDWISRVEGNPWLGKPVAILSATAGRSGGERAQQSVVLCLMTFRPRFVLGPPVMVAGAMREFDDDGRLSGESYQVELQKLMDALKAEVARGG